MTIPRLDPAEVAAKLAATKSASIPAIAPTLTGSSAPAPSIPAVPVIPVMPLALNPELKPPTGPQFNLAPPINLATSAKELDTIIRAMSEDTKNATFQRIKAHIIDHAQGRRDDECPLEDVRLAIRIAQLHYVPVAPGALAGAPVATRAKPASDAPAKPSKPRAAKVDTSAIIANIFAGLAPIPAASQSPGQSPATPDSNTPKP